MARMAATQATGPCSLPIGHGLRGVLRHNEPLDRHTVFGVGGPAARFYRPADSRDLGAFLQRLPATEPVLWLGLGSNLLVRDGGFAGTVVQLAGPPDGLMLVGETAVRVEAGVACGKFSRFCARHGLQGAEFLAGIPGTVGGALAMNAGAFGGETWPLVRYVETLDRQGRLHTRSAHDFQVGYREVTGPPGEWFVAAEFLLAPDDREQVAARMRELLHRRNAAQPTRWRSCGSVFRNPPGDQAGRLIEACGLKGLRIGGAVVSEKHANFILNEGRACASDIEMLMYRVRQAVRQRFGVCLMPEVRIVGERPKEGRRG